MSVVLPAPFGPSRPKNSPGSTCEVDAVEGDDGLRLDVVDAADAADVDGERPGWSPDTGLPGDAAEGRGVYAGPPIGKSGVVQL